MSTQHTPTPWRAEHGCILAEVSRGNYLQYPVAYLSVDQDGLANGGKQANAAFIVLATNAYERDQATIATLLEAAEAALVAWETDPTTFSDDDLEAHYVALAAAVSKLRATIRAAEGRTEGTYEERANASP